MIRLDNLTIATVPTSLQFSRRKNLSKHGCRSKIVVTSQVSSQLRYCFPNLA